MSCLLPSCDTDIFAAEAPALTERVVELILFQRHNVGGDIADEINALLAMAAGAILN